MLSTDNLMRYSQSKADIKEILSPSYNSKNISRFITDSKNQKKFNERLELLGLEVKGALSEDLKESIQKTKMDIEAIKNRHCELSNSPELRGRLDFDIAKAVHSNLNFPRIVLNQFDFWRWLTLNHFIENVRWRWVRDPANMDKITPNAKTVFQRAFGERDRRIDCLRYWMIGERLYDSETKYAVLDSLSESAKRRKGPFQDFINNIIDTNLLSPNDNISKQFGLIMLTGEKTFSTTDLIASFKRYNASRNRLLVSATESDLKEEICISQTA